MAEDAVIVYVRDFFAQRQADESSLLSDDSDLLTSEIYDSLLLQELIASLERQFDVEIAQSALTEENFGTIASVAAAVTSLRRGA